MTYKVNILRADNSPAEMHSFEKKPTYDEIKALLIKDSLKEAVDSLYEKVRSLRSQRKYFDDLALIVCRINNLNT